MEKSNKIPEYKHTKAAIYSHKDWVKQTNPEVLKTQFEAYLKTSGFTIIKFEEHYFEQQGYTCFWLLAESHLAIHTFPESNTSYIELSSCNEEKLVSFQQLMT
jgi:S-adenosylmethionine decarboxylase